AGLLRDRSELPRFRACARIERTRAAGVTVRPDDQQVFINRWSGVVWHDHIDLAFLAECGNRLAGVGVEADQALPGRKEKTRRNARFTRPECDASASRVAVLDLIAPDLFSSFGFQRDDAIVAGQIHHSVDDDRRDFAAAGYSFRLHLADLVGPCACEPGD